MAPDDKKIPAPPAPAARWIRVLLGLGVSVPVSLAPYLGAIDVPGFRNLLLMIPDSLRDATIPLSTVLMSIVAISVQWFDGGRMSREKLQRPFVIAAATALVGVLAFMWVQTQYVVRVQAQGGERVASFLVASERLPKCSCPEDDSDAQCINGLSWDEALIAQCWGDRPIRSAGLFVRSTYLLTTTSIGALVGFVVLGSAKNRSRR